MIFNKISCTLYLLFILTAKVLIATGFPYGKCQNVEIIDLTNPTYKCHYAINSDLENKEPLSISNESHEDSGKFSIFSIRSYFFGTLELLTLGNCWELQ